MYKKTPSKTPPPKKQQPITTNTHTHKTSKQNTHKIRRTSSPKSVRCAVCKQKHFLLATLLEAGVCSQEALGRPGPHPLFVDQARATLVQLDADDVHMSSCCHDR